MHGQIHLARQQRLLDLLDEARLVARRAHTVAGRRYLDQLGIAQQVGDDPGLRQREGGAPRAYADWDFRLRLSSDVTSAPAGSGGVAPSSANSSRKAST